MSIAINQHLLDAVTALDAQPGGTSAKRAAAALGIPLNTAADYLRRARGRLVHKRRKRYLVCDAQLAQSYCAGCRACMDGVKRAREWWEKYETKAGHADIEARVKVLMERARRGEELFGE